jgi:acyl-CoA reductase-like NAD-dependent aldehyde dehydrogenase
MDVGSVYVNNFYRWSQDVVPFGGNKESGFGRERSIVTLFEFAQSKTVKSPSGIGEIPGSMVAKV